MTSTLPTSKPTPLSRGEQLVGTTVTVPHPVTGKPATGTVTWASPTVSTLAVKLNDGTTAYSYPSN